LNWLKVVKQSEAKSAELPEFHEMHSELAAVSDILAIIMDERRIPAHRRAEAVSYMIGILGLEQEVAESLVRIL
jgi:hypothetical protein